MALFAVERHAFGVLLVALATGCAAGAGAGGGGGADAGGGAASEDTSSVATPDRGDAAVPDAVLDLLRDLPDLPRAMQVLHALAGVMHIEAAECAGFGPEERAQLEKFDELAGARAERQAAARALAPLMAAVRAAVVAGRVSELKACRGAQRTTARALALDALMGDCFGQTRADYSVDPTSGSTAYGDPLRLPPRSALRPSTACDDAATRADAAR